MIIRWYLGGLIAAAALGFVAAKCHAAGLAPVGLISIAAGGVLGFALLRWAAVNGISGRRRLVVGAVLLGLAAVFFEHAWLYVDFRRQWREAREATPQVALFRPEEPWSPAEYFRHELTAARAALWGVDAALLVSATVATVLLRRGATATNSPLPTTATSPEL